MFANFPKKRTELPEEYRKIYDAHYKSNRNGTSRATSFAQKMEKWLHRQVAQDVENVSLPLKSTLELGAGTLNQLDFEKRIMDYDVVEPFKNLYVDSKNYNRVRKFYDDISEIPLACKYSRVTSCATLEHVENLPLVVSHAALLLEEGGCFRASVPTEGGLLWKLGYSLTTGLEFKRKYNLKYSVLMKYEHINNIWEIEECIKYFFKDVQIKRFGLGKQLSFYTFICAKNPDYDRCKKYCF